MNVRALKKQFSFAAFLSLQLIGTLLLSQINPEQEIKKSSNQHKTNKLKIQKSSKKIILTDKFISEKIIYKDLEKGSLTITGRRIDELTSTWKLSTSQSNILRASKTQYDNLIAKYDGVGQTVFDDRIIPDQFHNEEPPPQGKTPDPKQLLLLSPYLGSIGRTNAYRCTPCVNSCWSITEGGSLFTGYCMYVGEGFCN